MRTTVTGVLCLELNRRTNKNAMSSRMYQQSLANYKIPRRIRFSETEQPIGRVEQEF